MRGIQKGRDKMIDININHRKQKWHLNFEEGIYFLVGEWERDFLSIVSMYCLYKDIPYIEVNGENIDAFQEADVAIINIADALDIESVINSLLEAGVKTVIVLLEKFYYSSRDGVKYRYVSNTPELITMFDINVKVGEKKC